MKNNISEMNPSEISEIIEESLQDMEQILREAQHWTRFEGVTRVISRSSLSGQSLVVITSCNPAAITAPIPSIFHGYPVSFWEAPVVSG